MIRVLFVGEGPHDIGRGGSGQDSPAGGVVAGLARRACPQIAADSPAMRWTELVRFKPGHVRGKGLRDKAALAVLLSHRRGCAGTICVVDRDRDQDRLPALREGLADGVAAHAPGHAAVCGEAVESIESWTLGARSALAVELGLPESAIAAAFPRRPEELYQNSGTAEHRPKDLLQRLAERVHRADGQSLREAVAAQTDVDELAAHCPQGFAPFLAALRAAF